MEAVSPALLATAFLAGVALPAHVGGPGAGHVAIGAGVEDLDDPAVDLRLGLHRLVAVHLEGVWHPRAPLVGGAVRVAAGSNRRVLFANAWVQGHLRPVITTDVRESLAGSDVGAGLGVVALWGPLSVGVDGGIALGIPVVEVELADIDPHDIDQQGGLFGLQRITLALDLGDHVELATHGSFALPVDSVRFNRRNEDVVGAWDARLGGRVFVRF